MEDFTEEEVFQLGLVSSEEGRAFQAEVSMCNGRGMKAKPENHCRAGAEGRQEENWTGSLGQNFQGHEWSY